MVLDFPEIGLYYFSVLFGIFVLGVTSHICWDRQFCRANDIEMLVPWFKEQMANSVYCDPGLSWFASLLLERSLDFLSLYHSVVTSARNHQAVSFCILASLRWIHLQVGKRVFYGEETKVVLDVGLCNLRTMFCMSHQIHSPFM